MGQLLLHSIPVLLHGVLTKGVTMFYAHSRNEPETQVAEITTPRPLSGCQGQDLNPGWQLLSLELCTTGSMYAVHPKELSEQGRQQVA